jgi:hypothetical protein
VPVVTLAETLKLTGSFLLSQSVDSGKSPGLAVAGRRSSRHAVTAASAPPGVPAPLSARLSDANITSVSNVLRAIRVSFFQFV